MRPYAIRHLAYGFATIGRQLMHPEDVCKAAEPVMEEIGVTEVRDITSVDRLGIRSGLALHAQIKSVALLG